MKKHIIRQTGVILFAMAALVYAMSGDAGAFDRQSSNENGVRVDVLPVSLEAGKSARFEIRLNTHSGDLNQDLTTVSQLRAGDNTVLGPEGWDGSPPGGHHRSGVLRFPTLPSGVNVVTLTIRDVANVPERNFQWNVK